MAILTETDTCRKYVLPKLYGAGWDDGQITEQKTFTDGRIFVGASKPRRGKQKRADYLLRYRPDFTIAVVEAKPTYMAPGEQRRIVEYLDDLQAKVDNLKKLQEETSKELDALMTSILSNAFSGEL